MSRFTLDLRLCEDLKNEKLLSTNQQLENQSCFSSEKEAPYIGMLSLGCKILNKFFKGGLPLRGITEIAGESSSGKTQICLQLAMMLRAPEEYGLHGVLFVCTEDPFPIRRLTQLIESSAFKGCAKQIMDGIIIEHIEDIDGLQTCLEKKLPVLARQKNIKLLIVDSVAAPFRCHYGATEASQRAQKLYLIGSLMHRLNEEFGMAIICVNQVTDVLNNDIRPKSSICAPSLGLAWSNVINTRIVVSRTTSVLTASAGHEQCGVIIRKMDIIFSPCFPPSCCYFVIHSSGVRALRDNETIN